MKKVLFAAAVAVAVAGSSAQAADLRGPGYYSPNLAAAYSWNDRKRRFSHDQLALAHSVLQRKGWLEARTA